jgi:hypothetical protein
MLFEIGADGKQGMGRDVMMKSNIIRINIGTRNKRFSDL